MFDKKEFSKILKDISALYENQREFAKLSNINRTYISKYINMKYEQPPSHEFLFRLAKSSKGTVDYVTLMKVCGYFENNSYDTIINSGFVFNDIYNSNTTISNNEIPLIKINNIHHIFSKENIIGTIPFKIENENENYFAYIASDDFMAPLLQVGDIAIIRKEDYYINKETYLLCIKNELLTVAKVIETLEGIDLYVMSMNKPIYEKLQKNDIKILGKVVKVQNESYFK